VTSLTLPSLILLLCGGSHDVRRRRRRRRRRRPGGVFDFIPQPQNAGRTPLETVIVVQSGFSLVARTSWKCYFIAGAI
jgi:hypothetical protein